jgi:putative transposase
MKKSGFTEAQIVAILKEGEAGRPVAELLRKHRISSATYYAWKSKYGALSASELKRLKELEAENTNLKRLYADLALENHALKDLIDRNCNDVREARRGHVPSNRTSPDDCARVCGSRPVSRAAWYRPRIAWTERDAPVVEA